MGGMVHAQRDHVGLARRPLPFFLPSWFRLPARDARAPNDEHAFAAQKHGTQSKVVQRSEPRV